MQMRRVFTVLAIVLAGSLAFAQVSNTNASTAGTFRTDVDNFMDVNYWETVKPENMFGFLGFSGTSYDVGAAKQFGGIYVGGYFTGDLGSSLNETAVTGTTTTVTKDKGLAIDGSSYAAGLIVGIDQLGISGGFVYNDTTTHSYTSTTTAGTLVSYTDAQIYNMVIDMSVGYNLSAGGIELTPHVAVAYGTKAEKTAVMSGSGSSLIITDNSTPYLNFLIGSGADFGSSNGFDNYASLDVDFTTYLFPDYYYQQTTTTGGTTTTTTNTYVNPSHIIFRVAPAYTLTYAPDDRFAMKLNVSVPVSYEKNGKDATSTNGTSDNTKDWTSVLKIIPSLDLGMQYHIVPSKLTFNAGADFSLPTWMHSDVDNSTNTAADTLTYSYFDGEDDAGLALTSGFDFAVAKGIDFDCNWAILSNIMNAYLATDWETAATADAFWGNMNKMIFATVEINLVVKL